MLGRVVSGLRTWMCTIAAPALAASIADCAICAGVTGTAGFLPGVSADPVTAQAIITLRCMLHPLPGAFGPAGSKSLARDGDGAIGGRAHGLSPHARQLYLPPIVRCAKPPLAFPPVDESQVRQGDFA